MTQNIATLRSALFDEINSLRSNQSEPKRAAAVANLAKQIIATGSLELRAHKMRADAEKNGGQFDMAFAALPPVDRAA